MSNLPALRSELERSKVEFAKQLPGHITPEKFVRTAQTAIVHTRGIEKVTNPRSLLIACSKAAADGLVLDGREAALVVNFKGEVEYRPMMRGLLKLAWQSKEIKGLVVEIVRKGDLFRHMPTNLVEPIKHEINHENDRGDPYVVYALAELVGGGIVHEVMSVADVNRIRDRSDAWKAFKTDKIKSTPWQTDWSEMARKTVFRRISKFLPSSTDRDEFRSAVERIDEDFTFGTDEDGQAQAIHQPAGKKRGGAAAALRDITPKPAPEATTVPADEDGDDDTAQRFDPETGEVYDVEDPNKQPYDEI